MLSPARAGMPNGTSQSQPQKPKSRLLCLTQTVLRYKRSRQAKALLEPIRQDLRSQFNLP